MPGALVLAALIGLAPAAPESPDDLQWDELDEPEAPAPAPEEATAPEEGTAPEPAPPAEAAPPTEDPAAGDPPPEDPTTPTEPAEPAEVTAPLEEQPTEPDPPPEEESTEPETSVEFEPAPQREIADLQPSGDEKARERPDSLYGRLWAGPVLGGSSRAIAIGASATYFVVPWVGLGAELVNVFSWDPGYYEFQFTPKATLLMLPRRRFSPVAWGGFGVDTFTKGLGTYGRWNTGGGFIMLLGRRLILTLGVDVDGRVPESRWNRTFTCGVVRSNCTIGIGPVIGISFPFG